MKFFLYSLNYSPELTGIGKYNGELAHYMANRSVDVTVLTAPPYYPEWQVKEGYKNVFSTAAEKQFKVIRAPLYVPKNVTTLKRLIHLASFAITSGVRLLSQISKKPDVIMLVQPTLFCAPITLLFAKLTGAKSIMHIQDFEVDAMFGLGLVGSRESTKQSFLKKTIIKIESWLLKRFDVVSSISYNMLENAKNKGVEGSKLLFFPNWSDTAFVNPNVCGKEIRTKLGYDENDKVVLYSGNIGKKQGLEVVIDAAKYFKDQVEVKFLIIGNGAYSEELRFLAESERLSNIQFLPLQAWEDVPKILSMTDIHLVVQKKGAADAVLPSKLTNILSVGGHALVTAESHTELGKIEQEYPNIYKLVEPESAPAFIQGLESLLQTDTKQINQSARNYAEQNLNIDQVIGRFINDLNFLVKGKS